jgi:xanthine/CO dehydrogenase XdhC/CoxF family maturation factor
MDASLTELCNFYLNARERGDPLVLATIMRTEDSTYRKAGARILLNASRRICASARPP